ncbi:PBSX family phage terminase large subunit [Planomonospora venezuelensis]|uniref:PBSX family phage terminase large subunit n=1 Tax=Planomonospora venezuelensis TaxID=1999 RepID=A0A841DAB1_PLAVE|nr:PBSX family phage terminase large subunit [Planomonospora venezuelensis]MBB5965065.1 PBSX family phage terminase large subunit [Planomonospora venezuelensis]GIN05018.1 phage terminase large subunit [Planomonospora venezuelensis]
MAPRLSDLQEQSIAHATARINIWSGAVRSGKTISSLLRWLMYVAQAPRGGALVVTGKTYDTVSRNVFGPLQDPSIFGEAAQHVKYTRGAPTATILGRQIEVITANDAKAEGRLRGLTAAGAYVDELTLIPEDFFTQLLARLSVAGAKVFATTNPDGPAHWARKKFILRQGELDLRYWHFTLDDNPALDPAYVTSLKQEYVGLWYRRFILGEWCLAEGAVFDMWDETRHVVTELPPIVQWIAAGVDYGTVNPFAALMLGLGADGRLYFTREFRYDSKLNRRSLTDVEYSERLRTWLNGGGHERPQYVVVDPSAASFRAQLHYDGVTTAAGANEVLPGIRTVASLLATDRLRVHRSCAGWIEEVPGYSWDDKKAEKGEDEPIKAADHSLDAGRYAIHTTRNVWQYQLVEPGKLAA